MTKCIRFISLQLGKQAELVKIAKKPIRCCAKSKEIMGDIKETKNNTLKVACNVNVVHNTYMILHGSREA